MHRNFIWLRACDYVIFGGDLRWPLDTSFGLSQFHGRDLCVKWLIVLVFDSLTTTLYIYWSTQQVSPKFSTCVQYL